MAIITRFRTHDVRFPTSRGLHGSDAMNQDPDYSAAYLVLETDNPSLSGHSLVFTIGRGTTRPSGRGVGVARAPADRPGRG